MYFRYVEIVVRLYSLGGARTLYKACMGRVRENDFNFCFKGPHKEKTTVTTQRRAIMKCIMQANINQRNDEKVVIQKADDDNQTTKQSTAYIADYV